MLRTMAHDYTEQWERLPEELREHLSLAPNQFLKAADVVALAQAGIAITTSVRFPDAPEPNTTALAPQDFREWIRARGDAEAD